MMIGGNMSRLLGFLLHRHNNADRAPQPQLADRRTGSGFAAKRKIWIWPSLGCLLWLAAPAAADGTDYGLDDPGWSGLSELLAIARTEGIDVIAPRRIDLGALRPRDGLLIIYPSLAPPRVDLSTFMLEGGRLAVADDFGAGGALLAAFGVERSAPGQSPAARRLRGNINVLIAKPAERHPLGANVPALVTNHPQVLHHEHLDAIFSLDQERGAVVLSGGVGKGRLVALGDPSVLINNMLEFRGNRAFARNLIRYLAQNGRLFVAVPSTELIGHYGNVGASDPLAALRVGLARLAQVRLPPAALRITTLVVAALLAVAAATALPRRASYARAVSLPATETPAGFAGRVRFFASKGRNLLSPLVAYKLELERGLLEGLGLSGQPSLRDLAEAMRKAGLPESMIVQARELLVELERLALAQDRPPEAPHVGETKFRAMLAVGDRILAAVSRGTVPERRT
jgi:hypothetical protein